MCVWHKVSTTDVCVKHRKQQKSRLEFKSNLEALNCSTDRLKLYSRLHNSVGSSSCLALEELKGLLLRNRRGSYLAAVDWCGIKSASSIHILSSDVVIYTRS